MTEFSAGRHSCSGFTLIELLVAITMLALLTAVLMAGFQLATHAFQRQSTRLDRAAELPVVYDFLRSRLADARPIAPINRGYGAVAFEGRTTGVDFVGTAPRSASRGGLFLYSVDLTAGKLRVRWRRFDGTLPATDEGSGDTLLLDDVRAAQFRYFGAISFNAELAWRREWRGVAFLPLLVRLDLNFADGETPPALIVAPRSRPLRVIPLGAPSLAGLAP